MFAFNFLSATLPLLTKEQLFPTALYSKQKPLSPEAESLKVKIDAIATQMRIRHPITFVERTNPQMPFAAQGIKGGPFK